MNNLIEVNDDILKDWLMFREDDYVLWLVMRIEGILFILMRFLIGFWKMFQSRIKSMLRNNLIFLMRILWIIFSIGMRSIIGMGFVMGCSWLVDVSKNRKIGNLDFISNFLFFTNYNHQIYLILYLK